MANVRIILVSRNHRQFFLGPLLSFAHSSLKSVMVLGRGLFPVFSKIIST